MYCANCGVKLGDAETVCPLCATPVYHPALPRPAGEPLYPRGHYPPQPERSLAAQIVVTALFLLPCLITLVCNWQISGRITWSGYVVGGLLVVYLGSVLPFWFSRPDSLIFVPLWFTGVGLFLKYIEHSVSGQWFLPFALPVTAVLGLFLTALLALLRRFPKRKLLIFGGAVAALGVFLTLLEWLIYEVFQRHRFLGWSFYPLIVLILFGLTLVFLSLNRNARDAMYRKFFL